MAFMSHVEPLRDYEIALRLSKDLTQKLGMLCVASGKLNMRLQLPNSEPL